jgi:hypothetical protein
MKAERTRKLGDCAIRDFQEMVMGNYQQGRTPNQERNSKWIASGSILRRPWRSA